MVLSRVLASRLRALAWRLRKFFCEKVLTKTGVANTLAQRPALLNVAADQLPRIRVRPFRLTASRQNLRHFPVLPGILLGLGLGGFFDGIVLHQILQWHHMLTSAGYPPDSVSNLQINTLVDGLFHASTYVLVALGLMLLWRHAQHVQQSIHLGWSCRMLLGTILMGFGIFNLVEGVVDHHLLGLHHVNETAPREHWIYWDLGFLAWGALMLIVGSRLFSTSRRRSTSGSNLRHGR